MTDYSVKQYKKGLADLVVPNMTALVIVDMQNDFCARGGYVDRHFGVDEDQAKSIARNIMKLVKLARETSVSVIWIKANYEPKYLSDPILTKQANMEIDDICCAENSWGQGFFHVEPTDEEIVLEKHRYSAFFETPLDSILRQWGVRTLILAGVATNVCIDSTAREGFFRGYHIVIPQDCAGSHRPELHAAVLKNLGFLIGTICDAEDITKLWATQLKFAQ